MRKQAKLAKQIATNYQAWLTRELPKAIPVTRIKPEKHDSPGVYALSGRERVVLYVGETFNLGPRIKQIMQSDAWKDLEPISVRMLPEREPALHGLKSILIQRLTPALNSRLLFPKLEGVAS